MRNLINIIEQSSTETHESVSEAPKTSILLEMEERLSEAPIADIQMVGDWNKSSSFRHKDDRGILNSPKGVEKIKRLWQNTKQDYNMMMVNSPEAGRHKEVGEVNMAWLEENMPNTLPQLDLRDDAINVIFTNNSAAERVPMTAWTMAHRLGHAFWAHKGRVDGYQEIRKYLLFVMGKIAAQYTPSIRDDTYRGTEINTKSPEHDKILVALYSEVGTMKSARDRNIRNEFEFLHELFAQFIITGKVEFNTLPDMIKVGRGYLPFRGTEMDREIYDGELEMLAEYLTENFEEVLHGQVGRIFVM